MPVTELFNTSKASGLAIAFAILCDASSEKESVSVCHGVKTKLIPITNARPAVAAK